LALGILVLAVGCGPRKSVEHSEVQGIVKYKGNPLPGGRIEFVSAQGGFAVTETIDEEGKYKIKAPVGEVKIGIDNTALRAQRGQPGSKPRLQRPGSEEAHPMKGTYVDIPSKYRTPDQSGLTFTVDKAQAPQTHNIDLE
jgi:hypothetical protein